MAEGEDSRQAAGPEANGSARIALVDWIRGIAVMGILVINAAAIAGPGIAVQNPDWHGNAGAIDHAAFAATWLFFDGKMRAIFAVLFGVSLVLFLSRGAEHRRVLEQVRRLLWLAIFGYLHFALFWWGDILFTYAIAGMIALFFKDLAPQNLFALGLGGIAFLSLSLAAEHFGMLAASYAVVAGLADARQIEAVAAFEHAILRGTDARMAEYAMGFGEAIRYRLTVMPEYPLRLAAEAVLEALPLMLCGMGLAKSGFFTGQWPRRALIALAVGGAVIGLAWYGAILLYLDSQGFALTASSLLGPRLGMIGRLAMAASYLAAFVLIGDALTRGMPGQRIVAAGRMALSNYLGCTVVMTFLFHGWGLGLAGRYYGHASLMLFVLAGWAVMLAWSAPWLARFGIGPLEWVWRQLAGMGIRRAETAK